MQNIKHSLVYGITGFSELYNVNKQLFAVKAKPSNIKTTTLQKQKIKKTSKEASLQTLSIKPLKNE